MWWWRLHLILSVLSLLRGKISVIFLRVENQQQVHSRKSKYFDHHSTFSFWDQILYKMEKSMLFYLNFLQLSLYLFLTKVRQKKGLASRTAGVNPYIYMQMRDSNLSYLSFIVFITYFECYYNKGTVHSYSMCSKTSST